MSLLNSAEQLQDRQLDNKQERQNAQTEEKEVIVGWMRKYTKCKICEKGLTKITQET